jgi:8-oxo-dGTP pyrophosphatase MutT (NUDIX family)
MEIERYEAAGGIVIDRGDVLLLRKRSEGVVVLPKGHVDPGETPEQAALRETIEETGYTDLEVLASLGVLQAQFPWRDRWYIRNEHYFVVRLVSDARGQVGDYDDALHDQLTFERLWAPASEAAGLMTFEPARSFVRRAVAWWHKNEPPNA